MCRCELEEVPEHEKWVCGVTLACVRSQLKRIVKNLQNDQIMYEAANLSEQCAHYMKTTDSLQCFPKRGTLNQLTPSAEKTVFQLRTGCSSLLGRFRERFLAYMDGSCPVCNNIDGSLEHALKHCSVLNLRLSHARDLCNSYSLQRVEQLCDELALHPKPTVAMLYRRKEKLQVPA
jgi:hypothetical protein